MSLAPIDPARVSELAEATRTEALELFLKRGRSRRLVLAAGAEVQSEADERGWAVRATSNRASLFTCGTGEPGPEGPWPVAEGRPIRLPEPTPSTQDAEARPRISDGSASEPVPLASEGELRRLGRAIAAEVERTVPGGRVERLELIDGQSESRIASSKGISAGWRTRLATVSVEASRGRGGSGAAIHHEWLLPDLRAVPATRLGAGVARQLAIEAEGEALEIRGGALIAAPEVVCALLEGLTPLFVGSHGERYLEGLAEGGELGSAALDLLDDGGLEGGPLASPVDGEGTPTREVLLVEEGVYQQPLLPWWRQRSGARSGGCCRRDSWREPPAVGPSHLYLRPGELEPRELLETADSGVHLLGVAGPVRLDLSADRFELPTRGLRRLEGASADPIAGVSLTGTVSALLRGLRTPASDLRFVRQPTGLFGSPSVVLSGVDLVDRSSRRG